MLKNYFRVAIRSFWHNKLFSLINLLGLAIGISASLVIFLIVQYDYSFDRFAPARDRIYRVVSDYTFGGNAGHTPGTQAPLADAMKKELSGTDLVVSFRYYNAGKLSVPGTNPAKPAIFRQPEELIFADDAYFQLLPYQWLAGSQKTALAEPGRVVLSESRAKQYFPTVSYSNIIGRTIIYDDTLAARVSGIVRDLDSQYHSDFKFREFISLRTILDNTSLRNQFNWDDWGSTASDQQLYVRLGTDVKAAAMEAQLKALFEKYQGQSARKDHYTWIWRLQPVSDLHFSTLYANFHADRVSKPMLNGLMLIAGFLLALACINFINLTTAQATQRAKEIGIRKTLGGSRRQLIAQFLSETFLITLFATVLSTVITPLLLKAFADYLPTGLSFSPVLSSIGVFLMALVVVVSLLAGFFPALVLSSSNALEVLKNQAYAGTAKTRSAWVRQCLTVLQFVIALFFIMGSLLVSKQIRFMMDRDLGFNKEAILSINTPYRDTSWLRRVYLLEQLKQLPGVRMATLASDPPYSWGWWTGGIDYKDGKKDINLVIELKAVDTNYLRLFHIPLLAGRDILPNDTAREFLINETCLHALGFNQPQAAIGKMVTRDDVPVRIVGVIRDFNAHSLNYEIKPMVFCRSKDQSHDLIVALRQPSTGRDGVAGDNTGWQSTIAGIKTAFGKVYPQEDFSYGFLDEAIAGSYKTQERISTLLRWATGLTLFISCLGLLGLVIYVTNRRTKEIGIRKVLGASVTQIVAILSGEFLLLVAIAFVIAVPASWWAAHAWLDDFAYKTTLSWWVFLAGGLGMTLMALLTLSIRTVRAALANPVRSLRSE
jgi:putative ABC transport system permease protein